MRYTVNKKQKAIYKRLTKIKKPVLLVCGDRTRVLYPNGLSFYRYNNVFERLALSEIKEDNPIPNLSCFVPLWCKNSQANKLAKENTKVKGVTLLKTVKKMMAFDFYNDDSKVLDIVKL